MDGDDLQYGDLLCRLQQNEHFVSIFSDASALLAALAVGQRFDLLMLPPQHVAVEFERFAAVCKVLCTPMLVITPSGRVDMIRLITDALQAGVLVDLVTTDAADDEIEWRISTLVQRAVVLARETLGQQDLVLGGYRFIGMQRVVLLRERRIMLQPRQFELAQALFRNVGRVVTRGWLWSSFWGVKSPYLGARSLDVCVTNVRKKLDLRTENGFVIRSVYGHGYMLCSTEEPTLTSDASIPVGMEGRAAA